MITLQITAVTMSPVCPDLSLLCPPLLGGPPSSSLQNAATLKSVAQPSQIFSSAGRTPVTIPISFGCAENLFEAGKHQMYFKSLPRLRSRLD